MNNCDLLNFRFVDRIEAKKTLHDFINGTSAAPVLWISGEQGITDELSDAQLALDLINHSATFEVEL